MTVSEYLKHHGMYKAGDAFFPTVLQQKFGLADNVEYFVDAERPNRIAAICRARNYAAVLHQKGQAVTNIPDLGADIPALNTMT